MRIRNRWLMILTACAFAAVCLLSGCEKQEFDAGSYVQAMMDATYHNESGKFTEMDLGKKSEAETMHKETVDALAEALSDVLGEIADDAAKDRIREAVEGLCLKTDYKIGEVLEDNGVYLVDVKIKPIEFTALFEGETFDQDADAAVKAAMEQKEDITPEELNAVLVDLMMTRLEAAEKQPTFGEEEKVQIKVRKKDDLYEIPLSGWEMLDEHLIR